jgi:O-antigen/teichoic acid export membrane protein
MSLKMINSMPEEKTETKKRSLRIFFPTLGIMSSISKLLSDEGLTKKATFNAVASFLEYASNLVVTFILTPIIVGYLGEYFYGMWQVLNRIVGYISPTTGRPSYALKWTLANQRESDDYDEKRRQVNNSILVWVIFIPINLCAGGIVTWFVPYWINASPQYYWMIRVASALLVGNLILSAITQIPQSTLQGENKGYKRMGLSTILIFAENGLIWLALYLGWGIIGIAAALLAATAISGLFYLWVVRAYTPWFGVVKTSTKSLLKFLNLSWWFLGWNLVITLIMSSDVVVLGILQSVESVTSFTLTKYVPETIISVITMIVFGILPGLGGIIGTGNLEKASHVRGEIMAITWLMVTVLGSTIILWNRPFLALWVGEKQYSGTIPNLLIIMLAAQLVFIRNDGSIIDLTLRLSQKVILGAISVGVSILLAAVAVGYLKLGIIGLCIGIIVGRGLLSIGYPIIIGRFLKLDFLSQIKSALKPVLVMIVIYFLVTILDSSSFIHTGSGFLGWILFAIGAGATVIILLPMSFYLGLTTKQRKGILQRIRAVIPTR